MLSVTIVTVQGAERVLRNVLGRGWHSGRLRRERGLVAPFAQCALDFHVQHFLLPFTSGG